MNDHALRIIQIMQDKNMSPTQFSKAIGIQRAQMSHITLGRNNPTADVITKIILRFEDINPAWLLTGKGTMKIVPNQPNILMEDHQSHKGNLTDVESTKKVLSDKRKTDLFGSLKPQTDSDASDNIPPSHALKQQSNFDASGSISSSSTEGLNRTNAYQQVENRPAEDVNQGGNVIKIVEKEIVTYKEGPAKKIEKLVVFFSNKTFETLVPES